ncbi:MAG TPA: four-carbon acid sugar kinase family protein [Caulobacteraceae bacterium]|nr:four-carbon acid sugar kinase family protein [Caulobacteraceae bacterium]
MALELGVLADDLTGGMMIASLIEREGVVCPLATNAEALADVGPAAEAVVLARKIRLADPDVARAEARAAAAAFAKAGARRIYSKYCATFDSTERGNIGPIAEALMEAMGAQRTVFSPAFPQRRVTVFQGHVFLGPTLMGESFKRFDPATPMTESNLVKVLQAQTQTRVGLLAHETLARGKAAAEAELERQSDIPFFIVDAVDEADIERTAELTLDWPLITGGDSLAPALARTWRSSARPQEGANRRLLPPAPGKTAVLAGSCAAATLRQLALFEERHPVRRIDLVAEADDQDLAASILDWAAEQLEHGPVAIATSADRDGVAAAQARFGRQGAAARADTVLGALAKGLHRLGVRKFLVAGGETSGEVIGALGARRFEVSGFDDLGGGYCHQPGATPLSFVIKAGGMGSEDFFFAALARLAEADAAGKV